MSKLRSIICTRKQRLAPSLRLLKVYIQVLITKLISTKQQELIALLGLSVSRVKMHNKAVVITARKCKRQIKLILNIGNDSKITLDENNLSFHVSQLLLKNLYYGILGEVYIMGADSTHRGRTPYSDYVCDIRGHLFKTIKLPSENVDSVSGACPEIKLNQYVGSDSVTRVNSCHAIYSCLKGMSLTTRESIVNYVKRNKLHGVGLIKTKNLQARMLLTVLEEYQANT